MELDYLLEKIAKEENIHDYTITKSAGSEKGDGYSGDITCIQISGKNINREKPKVLNLILKRAATSDALRNQAPIIFRGLEKEKELPLSYFSPNFYGANVTDKNELLVLENLKISGYRLFECKIPMDENHVSLVLTEYGRLHALSLALRDQYPEKFATTFESMEDVFMKYLVESDFKKSFIERCAKCKPLLDSYADEKSITAYNNFVSSIGSFMTNLLEPIDMYSVALHGDPWTNNMLFKYKENDDSMPDQVRFIDFQLTRLGSPVLDLAYFFYACSSKTIIDNLNHYKQLYYTSLSSYLKKLGSDPDKVFPWSVFEDHWKKYAKYGLLFATLVIHVMLSEKDETVNLSESSEAGVSVASAFNYEIAKIDEYNDRVRHIMLHFIDNSLI